MGKVEMKRVLLSLLLLCGSVHATAAVYAVNDGNIYTSGASAWQLTETASGAQLVTLTGATGITASVVKCTAFTVTLNDVIRGMMCYCKALTTTGTNTVTISLYDTSSHIATGAHGDNCTITCTGHGLSENDCVGISGATGGANGNWFVHIVSSSQFTLIGSVGTSSGSAGTFSKWVPLTGTTATTTDNTVLQFVVEASGTAGWVNVHWPAGELYWADGLPMWREQNMQVNY